MADLNMPKTEREKFSRGFVLSLLGGGLLLLIMSFAYFSNNSTIDELKTERDALTAELIEIENQLTERTLDRDAEVSDAVYEATGLRPELVQTDTGAATAFFKEAFDWKDGTEYERAREGYMSALGEDNSFTDVYLPEDVVIETDDGDLSYIDHEGLKAHMDDMYIVPLTAEGETRIRYVGFVTYYMHRNAEDLVNLDALDASQAIVQFTASGDPDAGERMVSEVEAWSGFSAMPQ